jgi:hypothetical protein
MDRHGLATFQFGVIKCETELGPGMAFLVRLNFGDVPHKPGSLGDKRAVCGFDLPISLEDNPITGFGGF